MNVTRAPSVAFLPFATDRRRFTNRLSSCVARTTRPSCRPAPIPSPTAAARLTAG